MESTTETLLFDKVINSSIKVDEIGKLHTRY